MAQPPKKPHTPFKTQPQGGPPPEARIGTETVPAIHDWPGQRVDPRTFVGPNPVVKQIQGQMTSSGPAKVIDARLGGGIIPATGGAPSVPSSYLAPVEARGFGDTPIGTKQRPAYSLSRLDNYFLTRLPAAGQTFWHRKHVVDGNLVMSAPNTQYTLPMYTLPQGLSLVIMYFVQNWYDANLDPLDPDALTAFQSNQDAYGRVGINLLVNNAPVFDANEILFDPDGGANTTRKVSGFTLLDTNLLNIGVHPTAIYARDNAKISVRFTMSNTLPAHIPSAVGVELNGYLLPTKEFQELLISVRSQW
jgi:hypothetical protein